MTRIDVHPTFAMMRGRYSKPRVVGRLRRNETRVDFLKRMVELYPACTVYFVREQRGETVFEEVVKPNGPA
jgi:hypothetical protein